MASIFYEGFDHIDNVFQKWTSRQVFGGSMSMSATYARYAGGKGLGIINNIDTTGSEVWLLRLGLPTTDNTMIWSGAFYIAEGGNPSSNSGRPFLAIYANQTNSVQFTCDNFFIKAHWSGGSAISATPVTAQDWYLLEVKVVVDASTGSILAKVNGTTIINETSINTDPGSHGIANGFQISHFLGDSTTFDGLDTYWDDIYVFNTSGTKNVDFVGDAQILTLYPDGAGNYTQWQVTGVAANWDAVNEVGAHDGTGTMVYSSGTGTMDTYTMQDLTIETRTVYGVQLNAMARKDQGGDRTISPMVRSSGTDSIGTATAVNATFSTIWHNWDLDPFDNADWSEARINQLECGQELTS